MSLWSTLPAEEQLLTEPADEADLALASVQCSGDPVAGSGEQLGIDA